VPPATAAMPDDVTMLVAELWRAYAGTIANEAANTMPDVRTIRLRARANLMNSLRVLLWCVLLHETDTPHRKGGRRIVSGASQYDAFAWKEQRTLTV
jgi:hypothetical protein